MTMTVQFNENFDPEIIRRLERLKSDLPLFARTCLKIVDDEGNLIPFIFNESQMQLHASIEDQLKRTGMVRKVVPKGRKQGVSTYTSARFLQKAIFNNTKQVFILSHHSSTTTVLFSMVSTFYKHLPDQLKHKLLKDNDKYLEFENGSQYTVATAGEGEIGRGSTPQFLHSSEMASYKYTDQLQTGIFKAVAPVPGTEIIIESTAKGVGNMFHQYCMSAMKGEGRYEMFFLPWYIHSRNTAQVRPDFCPTPEEETLKKLYNLTDGQLQWRRYEIIEFKGDEWKFKQEYPCTVMEAFQTSGEKFFKPEAVARARQSTLTDSRQPLIIGGDAARDGDRTSLTYRRGRHVEKVRTFESMDQMRLAGIIAKAINEEEVDHVFLDTAHGWGTIDRLHELGFKKIVTGVTFNTKAMDTIMYANKRAEMYFEAKEWLEEQDTRIPDSEEMAMDLLCIPEAIETSSGRKIIPLKKEIKEKYGQSPDITDSFILTFAFPVKNRNTELEMGSSMRYNGGKKKEKESFGGLNSPIMDAFNKGNSAKKNKFNFNDRPPRR